MTRLILPGWHGSGEEHWQRLWLDHDPTAHIVEQPDWDRPDRDTWVANLHSAVAAATQPITLVAHSLGTALVAHYAVRYPTAPVLAALLVAPGDVERHAPTNPEIASFAPLPRTRLPFPTILVVSRNDELMDIDRALALAADWGARVVDLGDAGHINAASGYGRWPQGIELADELDAAAELAG